MKKFYLLQYLLLPVVLFISCSCLRAQTWTTKLDKPVRFYQTTDMGVVIVGTEKSVYAVDGSTGDILWRRKDAGLDENDVAPVPGSDLLLLSFEKSERTRVEAVDIMTGNRIWRSDKIKGGLMQMAVEPETNLLAIVLAKDAKGRASDGFKRRPLLHVLDLGSGDELWKNELSEVELMPSHWPDGNGEVEYALDNYHAPVFAGGRLYLFYEGLTSFDAQTGKSRLREKFRVNEEGLALTEADPIFTESVIYTSSHGRVRAISRESGDTVWEAKDLGLTPEMILAGETLYVRTGGQFTRLKDGETIERGPYGVSAIDTRKGKVLWRYKGADKGITNLLLPNAETIMVADRDDLITIDASNGKRRARVRLQFPICRRWQPVQLVTTQRAMLHHGFAPSACSRAFAVVFQRVRECLLCRQFLQRRRCLRQEIWCATAQWTWRAAAQVMLTNGCWTNLTRHTSSIGSRASCGIAIGWLRCADSGCISTRTLKAATAMVWRA